MGGSEFVTFDRDCSSMLQQALEQKRPVRIISELAPGKKTPKITDMMWAEAAPKNASEAARRMIEPPEGSQAEQHLLEPPPEDDQAPSAADITW